MVMMSLALPLKLKSRWVRSWLSSGVVKGLPTFNGTGVSMSIGVGDSVLWNADFEFTIGACCAAASPTMLSIRTQKTIRLVSRNARKFLITSSVTHNRWYSIETAPLNGKGFYQHKWQLFRSEFTSHDLSYFW